MTKERLTRLINLAVQREREGGLRETEAAVAYNDLLMEFQAWEPLTPERLIHERDAARAVARGLYRLVQPKPAAAWVNECSWLKETVEANE